MKESFYALIYPFFTSLKEDSEMKEDLKVQGSTACQRSVMEDWSAVHYAIKNLVPIP